MSDEEDLRLVQSEYSEDDDDDSDYIEPLAVDDEEAEEMIEDGDDDDDDGAEEDDDDDDVPSSETYNAIRQLLEISEADDDQPSRRMLSALLNRFRRTRPRPVADSPEDARDPSGWSVAKGGYKDRKEPVPEGQALLRSGEFGPIRQDRLLGPLRSLSTMDANIRQQTRRVSRTHLYKDIVPDSHGAMVATYTSRAYVGQYSADSSFFYTCLQDFDLHVYDTKAPITPPRSTYHYPRDHTTSLSLRRTIRGVAGQWTITDSHLSPDNSALIYSSLTPVVYMVKLDDPEGAQTPIPFANPRSRYNDWSWDSGRIYSCRFSTDSREIVAGGGGGTLYVFDLGAMKRTLSIRAHDDDINSCCWADTSSGNVLVSASDDTTLKVWDRRSLGGGARPSGVLIGHTEGITHVAPKGDGRYVLSNGKDQTIRLWDLRKMRNQEDWGGSNPYSNEDFDYRNTTFERPRHKKHHLDTSVMTYKGHVVHGTLIRCHFSPAASTSSRYIYSGSADGMIHIWSLDGRVVQVLDRSMTQPLVVHPSMRDSTGPPLTRNRSVVRDVSWHTDEPVLMSCSWDNRGSSVARHEWKGYGKNSMTVEDVLERDRLNALG